MTYATLALMLPLYSSCFTRTAPTLPTHCLPLPKLWFYLVLDRNDPKKTNQRIGDFFNSFGIADHSLGNGRQWVGKVGAVRVKHEEYNGSMSAKVAYVINRKNQDKLEPWKDNGGAPAPATNFQPTTVNPEDLPF